MIRIDLRDKLEYTQLREEYLNRISKYVGFNREDIVSDQIRGEESLETCIIGKSKTEQTADNLKKNFLSCISSCLTKKQVK